MALHAGTNAGATSVAAASFPLQGPSGTAAAPTYSLRDGTYGLYSEGAPTVDLSIAGTRKHAWSTNAYFILDDAATIQLGVSSDVIYARSAESCKGITRTLSVNVTAVGNVGAGTDDLMTYAIPANFFSANGRAVRVTARGRTTNNANGKTLTFVVGSQTVLTTALTTSIAGQWEVVCEIVRTGSNTQDVIARTLQGATLIFDQENTAGTQTDSATITVKCTGAATSDNDIIQESMIVEAIN